MKNALKHESYFSKCGELDALLGRKDQAIREARKAVEMRSIARDPINGAFMLFNLTQVYVCTDERDLALEQLAYLSTIPSEVSYGDLRFNPTWDSLRGDRRFEKIVASLKPRSN